ncbi:hypothetical protein PPL_01908 [Heterostelium album PN500]|uniref:Uncharacterized protein n=1 Tax=Heterostelium pallidum (strain ATCC 26659 / Pp 5 / PN500) TaxID=670386 RepID=D3B0U1_HETP5|nr:hypothetical protein PPL_01908 [Heterostelium album PN500]EFA84915.1 hypothetical protein PPL_01908 [Heterostelium album PN500]|eukprot:XP_020437025.1 hypothetical protein PPL_01908 [Heterostelium album PN500]
MTTKEILDLKLFNKDQLSKMKRDELIEIIIKHSLKHSGLKKDLLIDAIIKHQEQIIDFKSKLVTDNSIEKYHRGTVEYRLPTLIIYRIIRDLWYDDINLNLNIDNLCPNYRWLLSIALVSKEFFKLISSLFTRSLLLGTHTVTTSENLLPDMLAQKLKESVLNPHSILKNINHLTLSLEILKEITNGSLCTSVELGLIFNNVRKFKLKLTFSSELLSNSLKKLKLPESISSKSQLLRILPEDSQVNTLGLCNIRWDQLNMISGHFKNITKLIIWTYSRIEESMFEELLSSPECKVHTLYTMHKQWLTQVLSVNTTIETLNTGSNLFETIKVAVQSASVKRIIFHSYTTPTYIYDKRLATGYAHIKSKYRYLPNSSIAPVMNYAKKIYNISKSDDNQAIEATYPNLKCEKVFKSKVHDISYLIITFAEINSIFSRLKQAEYQSIRCIKLFIYCKDSEHHRHYPMIKSIEA